jgi:TnpA family transposase
LAKVWGGGTLSSSDGQRFPAAVRSQTARPLPRYFGFGAGLTFYSWSSDQFSQYGSKPTFSTLRDATVVLDGILDNETELPIVEHTTDTAGYTDLIFGTNAVVVWNTVYMNEVIKQLRAEGYPIDDADVAHLSPARYEHINPYGKYPFNIDEAQKQGQLRPLRKQ